jgi:alpha-mannosidase
LDENFALFEKYPAYVFNFTGSRRYRLMREYYPGRYDRLKKYIDKGRWHVSGSSVDEGDVNAPSPESVIRQVLYGNQFFREAFGKESVDYMLPDCFGFQAHMPSVWAHCGILGFSTQKLKWGSAVGIPFDVGVWEGPDGESVIMANSIRSYVSGVDSRVDTSSFYAERLEEAGREYGFYGGYTYYGVGDVGGAPREKDVRHLMEALERTESRIKVIAGSSDRMYRDITPEIRRRLPVYKGDLLLTEHSAASITSQAYMKRWNRKSEKLARAAELSAAMADWSGFASYPFRKLNHAWELVLGSQMHDILPGTSIPSAYHYAWNDMVIAMNGFASVEKNTVGAFTRALDTRVQGTPVVVYNPVAREREDVVEATIKGEQLEHAEVFGPGGKRVPSQVVKTGEEGTEVIFLARVPSAGYAVYDIRPRQEAIGATGSLRVTGRSLENARYRVTLNDRGDVASVYDKRHNRELLESPARLAFLKANPRMWPAWNMSWRERIHEPAGYVEGEPRVRITEKGPVRVSLEVTRRSRGSVFRQTISLAAGEAGDRLVFDNKVIWKSRGTTLKAVFPLNVHNFKARYNLGLGTIERPGNHSRQYEVPSREWIDLTDTSGTYGISVLDDCKHGSDKPDGHTLRLTLLHTPVANSYHDQATQDMGTHAFTYALYGHRGNWNEGGTEWQGLFVNQPLRAFSVPRHAGRLGSSFSFARLNKEGIAIRALKKAEDGSSFIVRLQELTGEGTDSAELMVGAGIASAAEVDGQERKIRDLKPVNGRLVIDMEPYAIRSLSVKPEPFPVRGNPPASVPIELPFNRDVVSRDANRSDGAMDDSSRTYPGEMLPGRLVSEDIEFALGSSREGSNNALECRGQQIRLPQGDHDKLYLLASARKETTGTFAIGANNSELRIQAWTGWVGQWDKREFVSEEQRHIKGIKAGYIKPDNIAWYASHHHQPGKNVAYEYSYLYKYALDIPQDAQSITLPDNDDIVIFAMSAAVNPNDEAAPLKPLYDRLDNREGFEVEGEGYYGEDLEPYAQLSKTQKSKPDEVFSTISKDDYANLNSLNGVTMTYYPKGKPYTRASVRGEKLLLQDHFDGSGKSLGSFDEVIWYDNGEGRYVMDLQKPVSIDSIRTFSPVFSHYGIPVYSVWATDQSDPEVKGNPQKEGWTYLGCNREGNVWGKAWNRTTIKMPRGGKRFRYIMWVADQNWHGTHYFFEVDVFKQE